MINGHTSMRQNICVAVFLHQPVSRFTHKTYEKTSITPTVYDYSLRYYQTIPSFTDTSFTITTIMITHLYADADTTAEAQKSYEKGHVQFNTIVDQYPPK